MDLHIDEHEDGPGITVLTVQGSIDLESRARLLDAGHDALRGEGAVGLVLDLSAVGFVDSSGIGAFVDLARQAEDSDLSFAIRNPSPRVLRVLQVTGLAHLWTNTVAPAPEA